MSQSLVALLKARLASNPAGAPTPQVLVSAGVLVPLFFKDRVAHMLFTQRTFTVKDHRGQISFPGGVRHQSDPDLRATALRETQEEIGLDPQVVEVLGLLPPLDTITGYRITPFVGLIPHPYDFHPSPQEVKRLLLLPLEGFYGAARWSAGVYHYRGRATGVHYWRGNGEVIWGATAQILLHLLALLGQHPIAGGHDDTCLD